MLLFMCVCVCVVLCVPLSFVCSFVHGCFPQGFFEQRLTSSGGALDKDSLPNEEVRMSSELCSIGFLNPKVSKIMAQHPHKSAKACFWGPDLL